MFTMAMAADALADFSTTASISNAAALLSGIRIGAEGPNDCLLVAPAGQNVVCRAGDDEIVVKGADAAEVANVLLAACDRARAIEVELASALAGGTLQDIVDVGARMAGCPLLLADDQSMMCIMGGEFADDALPEIRYARINGRLPWNAFEFMDRDMVFASRLLSAGERPFDVEVFGRRAHAVVCRIASDDGAFTSFLFALCDESHVTPGRLQAIEVIADSIHTWVDAHDAEERLFSKIDMLARLAAGEPVPDEDIAATIAQMGGTGEFVLARVLHPREAAHARAAARIQESIAGSRCFEFKDVLFALCPGTDETLEVLGRLASEHGMRFGLSWKFADLRIIAEAVNQTDIALSYTADKVAVLDSHCVMFYVFTMLTSQTSNIDIGHPAIEELARHDARHNTEYLRTLWVYLRHERNLVGTSEDLGIHRNSLIYRIRRIEEMVPDLNLDDPEVREHLMMSYRVRGLRVRSEEDLIFGFGDE